MDALNFDIMNMVGQEVQIVRQTLKNKKNYVKVLDDINSFHSIVNLNHNVDFNAQDASICKLFLTCYCLGKGNHPFIDDFINILPDDTGPEDLYGYMFT